MGESTSTVSQSTLPDCIPANRYVVFAVMSMGGLAADLLTKSWVFSWPGTLPGHVDWLVQDYIGIQTSLNEGALFGMGQGKVFWFAAVSLVAAMAIPAWLFIWRAAHDWWLTMALGGIFGGVLGNLYDRLGLHGLVRGSLHPQEGETIYAVRDWILFQANDQWRWPNFNIADSLLVVGAAVLFFRALKEPKAKEGKPSS